jgi:tetratricopeptide (TPR) repeat protein
MSLLMQALKKAERAQQNAAGNEDLDRPSTEFDAILELSPEPELPASISVASTRSEPSLSLEPLASLSLEPMTLAPLSEPTLEATTPPARPASAAQPASLALPPVADAAAPTASAAPVHHNDAAATQANAAAAAAPAAPAAASQPGNTSAASSARIPAGATTAGAAPARTAATAAATPAASRTTQDSTGAARSASSAARPEKSAAPRGAARARGAASSEPSGIDPERLRLLGLIGLLVLILAGFGYYYWQAVMAPGAGSRLPPVPMPPPGATGATPAQLVTLAARTDLASASDDAALLPAAPKAAPRDDLERRLAQAEQQLAATQQALQAQQSAPHAERLPPLAAPESSDIRVARGVKTGPLAGQLGSAYQAFNGGDLSSARQQYEAALQHDPNNRDALLGLASIATREQQPQQAAGYYLRLLELDPQDGAAIAGLVNLRQGDPAQNELRLKGVLAAHPDAAPVHFALGNLYAQQGRWQEAQQAYFQAYSAAPANADYAYNLAIGLDRLNQGKLAATYYQRALTLSQDSAATFDRAALRKRLQELSGNAR